MIIYKLIKHIVPGSQPQINRPFVYSLSRDLSTSNMVLFGWLTDLGSNEVPHRYCRLNLEEKRLQKISKINRENHAKFEDVHCTKSLPKFIDEKKKKCQWKIIHKVIILMTSDLLLCCLMVVGSYPLHLKKSTMDTTQTFVFCIYEYLMSISCPIVCCRKN
ncbi:hypothetical protein P8452_46456 [Trifolium repens]|nr:hypothetical protein P8452_46456 [Trifolium repens]